LRERLSRLAKIGKRETMASGLLAKASGESLLYKGKDFGKTDLTAAE
jgi:uncharacterized protein with PIN domain